MYRSAPCFGLRFAPQHSPPGWAVAVLDRVCSDACSLAVLGCVWYCKGSGRRGRGNFLLPLVPARSTFCIWLIAAFSRAVAVPYRTSSAACSLALFGCGWCLWVLTGLSVPHSSYPVHFLLPTSCFFQFLLRLILPRLVLSRPLLLRLVLLRLVTASCPVRFCFD